MGKCLSHDFKFSLWLNLWYTFGEGCRSGWEIQHIFTPVFQVAILWTSSSQS